MCKEGFYSYKNSCVTRCPSGTKVVEQNKLCVDIPKCEVENCEECNNERCSKCLQGFFLHENECSEKCPLGTRANRVDFNCVNKSTFAFFMIFPSKFSCKNKCGFNERDGDCSCHHHCLKDGNCCDDFEKECPDEIKTEKCKACVECIQGKCARCDENAQLVSSDCICKTGFYYDLEFEYMLDKFSKSDIGIKIINNEKTTIIDSITKLDDLLSSIKNL